MASWICRLSVDLFWNIKHATSVLIQNIQIMAGDQKMWSNCIFHFIFLEKVSFIKNLNFSNLTFFAWWVGTEFCWDETRQDHKMRQEWDSRQNKTEKMHVKTRLSCSLKSRFETRQDFQIFQKFETRRDKTACLVLSWPRFQDKKFPDPSLPDSR